MRISQVKASLSRPTVIVEKFAEVIDPFCGANKAESHAEAHQASDGCHEVDVRDLVLLDDARVVRLLEKYLQSDQIFFGITKQNCQVVWIYNNRSIESEVGLVAQSHKVEIVVVGRADVALWVERGVAK